MNMALRIGILKYTNAAPFYSKLFKYLKSKYIEHEVVVADPVTMYKMFQCGMVDVALLSSVVAPVLKKQGDKIFDAGISSIGPVKSVLLVTNNPLIEHTPCKIAVTKESNTSITLLKILFDAKNSGETVFWRSADPVNDLNKTADGALLIGDEALKLFYEEESGELHRFHITDIGELWYKWTSLPMVWGCWCSKNGISSVKEQLIEEILLLSSNLSNDYLNNCAYEYIKRGDCKFSIEEFLSYWKQFKYKIDDFAKQGLERFLDLSKPYIEDLVGTEDAGDLTDPAESSARQGPGRIDGSLIKFC